MIWSTWTYLFISFYSEIQLFLEGFQVLNLGFSFISLLFSSSILQKPIGVLNARKEEL